MSCSNDLYHSFPSRVIKYGQGYGDYIEFWSISDNNLYKAYSIKGGIYTENSLHIGEFHNIKNYNNIVTHYKFELYKKHGKGTSIL